MKILTIKISHLAASAVLCLFFAITSSAVLAQDREQPSEIRKVGDVIIAYYEKSNRTEVMAGGRTIFDNSTEDWPVAKGAQRIQLLLSRRFSGKKVGKDIGPVNMILGSVAGLPARFNSDGQRQFRLAIDGKEVSAGTGELVSNVPTSWVTYEDVAISLPLEVCTKIIEANLSVELNVGKLSFRLTRSDIQLLGNFLRALNTVASPQ